MSSLAMTDTISQLLWLGLIPAVPALLIVYRDMTLSWAVLALFKLWILKQVVQKCLGLLRIGGLDRRAVFITGCDTGFGNLLALKCLSHGMPVYAGCLTEKGAAALRDAARSLPGRLETIIVDVGDDESVQKAAAHLEKATVQYGGLHGVVNNAGIRGTSFFDDMLTTSDYKKAAEVNTYGVIRVTQATKHLVKKTRGRIVTVASICARVGIVGLGPYTVSKYAATGYCEVIRQELQCFGVSVHILEPGFFITPLIDQGNIQTCLDDLWKRVPKSVKEEYGEKFFHQSFESAAAMLHKISSPRVDLVVDAYFHALTARFPQMRYQIGVDSAYFFIPVSYLPTGCGDAIFAFIKKLSGAPVPEAALQKYSKTGEHTSAMIDEDKKTNTPLDSSTGLLL